MISLYLATYLMWCIWSVIYVLKRLKCEQITSLLGKPAINWLKTTHKIKIKPPCTSDRNSQVSLLSRELIQVLLCSGDWKSFRKKKPKKTVVCLFKRHTLSFNFKQHMIPGWPFNFMHCTLLQVIADWLYSCFTFLYPSLKLFLNGMEDNWIFYFLGRHWCCSFPPIRHTYLN